MASVMRCWAVDPKISCMNEHASPPRKFNPRPQKMKEQKAPQVSFEEVALELGSYKSIVSAWLKHSDKTSDNKADVSKPENIFSSSSESRPARLGIGAKITNQKEQLSNSVFLNEKLAKSLTGQGSKQGKFEQRHSFMKDYARKNDVKTPSNNTSKINKSAESDEEDSRTKSIGKRPPPAFNQNRNKQNKR